MQNLKIFTPEELEALKASNPLKQLFVVEVEGTQAVVSAPSRAQINAAIQGSKKAPLRFGEILLDNCWVDGDEAIKTDDRLFMGASEQLQALIEPTSSSIKKL